MQRHDRKRLSDRDDAAAMEELCTWLINARLQSNNPIGGTTEIGDIPPTASDFDKTGVMALADSCSIRRNGCLYRTCQRRGRKYGALFPPIKLREPVCIAFHNNPTSGGHLNWMKTVGKIAHKFFQPTMEGDVYGPLLRRMSEKAKSSGQARALFTKAIFHKVYIDLSGPFHTSSSSKKYIMCLIDRVPKYVTAAPLSDCSATPLLVVS
uniref:Reverse transcriptase domain-containing protein n=1 Tax=Haemonchus contortus TaxID=6289 RepID=A0A7I4Y7I7_HAECO|nr:hypothetical protein HCOI_00623300 [Haemonchus contortus]